MWEFRELWGCDGCGSMEIFSMEIFWRFSRGDFLGDFSDGDFFNCFLGRFLGWRFFGDFSSWLVSVFYVDFQRGVFFGDFPEDFFGDFSGGEICFGYFLRRFFKSMVK